MNAGSMQCDRHLILQQTGKAGQLASKLAVYVCVLHTV